MAKKVDGENFATYTREQVIQSQKYRPYRDALAVALVDSKSYTTDEIEKIKDEFLKRPVKEKINGKKE